MKRTYLLIASLLTAFLIHAGEAKYIFYFIGDGMGANQVLTSEMYLAELDGRIGRNALCFTRFPYAGQVTTYSTSNGITDSAAAGTALATGSKTNNGTLGLNAQGDTLTTIAEQLKAAGWGVGLLTTVAIDHATPAAFYANVKNRNDYYTIGTQLAYSDFDFFGGAGFHTPQTQTNKTNLYDLAERQGYTIASGLKNAQRLDQGAKKMIFVQEGDGVDKTKEGSNFPYVLDRTPDDLNLKELTAFAINFLAARHDRFFMMVEGGMIDYACHGQDAASAINETLDMDAAVCAALEFYNNHPDETLIIVTADHETGGMALGNSQYTLNLQLLQHQHCSSWVLSDAIAQLYNTNTDTNINTNNTKNKNKNKTNTKAKAKNSTNANAKNSTGTNAKNSAGTNAKNSAGANAKNSANADTQNNVGPTWDNVKNVLSDKVGLYTQVPISDEEDTYLHTIYEQTLTHEAGEVHTLYKDINALANAAVALLNRKAMVGWTSYSHTGAAVPIFSIGTGAELFTGWMDNTDIVPRLQRITHVTPTTQQ